MAVKLLAPVFALVIWSLIMLGWMAVARMPALARLKPNRAQLGDARGADMERLLPREINWPAHNYVHLMEQPTLFYATVLGLAVLGQGHAINIILAWSYVSLRIAHSIWQAKGFDMRGRAGLFAVSSVVLLALAVHGLIGVLAI